MPPRIAAIALLLPLTLAAAVPDPRPAVLRAIFPGQKVALLPGAKLDASFVDPTLPFSWPDALAAEPVYLVSGAPQFRAELCAAESLLTEKFSSHREVRIRTVPWPGQPATALLALVQYKFQGASPASSCSSIGLLVRLTLEAGAWRRRQTYLLEARHHSSIQRFELAPIDGSTRPTLIVESNSGGAETLGSSLQVFDLSNNAFDEILNTSARVVWSTEVAFTQHLELPRTRADQARRFHLVKTTYIDKGVRLPRTRARTVKFSPAAPASTPTPPVSRKTISARSARLKPLSSLKDLPRVSALVPDARVVREQTSHCPFPPDFEVVILRL